MNTLTYPLVGDLFGSVHLMRLLSTKLPAIWSGRHRIQGAGNEAECDYCSQDPKTGFVSTTRQNDPQHLQIVQQIKGFGRCGNGLPERDNNARRDQRNDEVARP